MDVSFAALADFASVSAEGKLNVMGIFDQVNARQMPAQILAPYLVIRLQADSVEAGIPKTVRVQLVDPDGKTLISGEQVVTPQAPDEPGYAIGFNLITRFPVLQFPRPGPYRFAILINDEHRGGAPIRVNAPPGGDGEA